jgi:hypothetical protein
MVLEKGDACVARGTRSLWMNGPGTGAVPDLHQLLVPKALGSVGKDTVTKKCAKNSDPASRRNPQPHKHYPVLTFAIQMRLNMTSSIPVDKPW